MMNPERYKRIRILVKGLNKQRRRQAKQIDILCNDIIQAHRGFINNLDRLAFNSKFNESIIGINDLNHLLYAAAGIIKQNLHHTSLAFFINFENDSNLYSFEAEESELTEEQRMEQYFNNKLVSSVINSGKPCKIDDLLKMGLQIKPTIAKKLSVLTIPLVESSLLSGFILLYCSSNQPLCQNQVDKLTSIRRSLSVAIKACSHPAHSSN